MICAYQERQITILHDLHGLQIMLPGEGEPCGLNDLLQHVFYTFPGLDLYCTDPAQHTTRYHTIPYHTMSCRQIHDEGCLYYDMSHV